MAFERVGSSQTIRVDVRILAATHQDLEALIRAGRFREDLFYRLNVIPIRTPSLRERKEDIFELAVHFLGRHAERMDRASVGAHRRRRGRGPDRRRLAGEHPRARERDRAGRRALRRAGPRPWKTCRSRSGSPAGGGRRPALLGRPLQGEWRARREATSLAGQRGRDGRIAVTIDDSLDDPEADALREEPADRRFGGGPGQQERGRPPAGDAPEHVLQQAEEARAGGPRVDDSDRRPTRSRPGRGSRRVESSYLGARRAGRRLLGRRGRGGILGGGAGSTSCRCPWRLVGLVARPGVVVGVGRVVGLVVSSQPEKTRVMPRAKEARRVERRMERINRLQCGEGIRLPGRARARTPIRGRGFVAPGARTGSASVRRGRLFQGWHPAFFASTPLTSGPPW